MSSFIIIAVPLWNENQNLLVKVTFLTAGASVIIGSVLFLWMSFHMFHRVMTHNGMMSDGAVSVMKYHMQLIVNQITF